MTDLNDAIIALHKLIGSECERLGVKSHDLCIVGRTEVIDKLKAHSEFPLIATCCDDTIPFRSQGRKCKSSVYIVPISLAIRNNP